MTTIKKGTILREKVFDGDYRKVLAVADDVVFTSGWEEDKESLIKEKKWLFILHSRLHNRKLRHSRRRMESRRFKRRRYLLVS